jgi:hypothetical protein
MSWLINAYLAKHDGRWVRYHDEEERRTEYSTPFLYLVKIWAKDAIAQARRRAWTEQGEDYWATMNRIAYEIATSPEYPPCSELDDIWHKLAAVAA